MKQRLSEWIDGELDAAEADRILGALQSDSDLRTSCDTYHLIGDALRGEAAPGIAQAVASRLAREPVVLAPQRRTEPAAARLARWSLSLAAAAAAVALVSWAALPLLQVEAQQAAAPVLQGGAAADQLAVVRPATPAAGVAVANYLSAHHRYSSMGAMQGVAPYARVVSEEQGDNR